MEMFAMVDAVWCTEGSRGELFSFFFFPFFPPPGFPWFFLRQLTAKHQGAEEVGVDSTANCKFTSQL